MNVQASVAEASEVRSSVRERKMGSGVRSPRQERRLAGNTYGARKHARDLLPGETVQLGPARGTVASIGAGVTAGQVRVEFVDDAREVFVPADSKWLIIDSPYSHLTNEDILALVGWLFPSGAGGFVGAGGAG